MRSAPSWPTKALHGAGQFEPIRSPLRVQRRRWRWHLRNYPKRKSATRAPQNSSCRSGRVGRSRERGVSHCDRYQVRSENRWAEIREDDCGRRQGRFALDGVRVVGSCSARTVLERGCLQGRDDPGRNILGGMTGFTVDSAHSLSKVFETYVSQKVESELYHSASEVLRDGLRLMMKPDELHQNRLAELRREIAIGVEQADRGQVQPFNEEVTGHVKARGRKRLAADDKAGQA